MFLLSGFVDDTLGGIRKTAVVFAVFSVLVAWFNASLDLSGFLSAEDGPQPKLSPQVLSGLLLGAQIYLLTRLQTLKKLHSEKIDKFYELTHEEVQGAMKGDTNRKDRNVRSIQNAADRIKASIRGVEEALTQFTDRLPANLERVQGKIRDFQRRYSDDEEREIRERAPGKLAQYDADREKLMEKVRELKLDDNLSNVIDKLKAVDAQVFEIPDELEKLGAASAGALIERRTVAKNDLRWFGDYFPTAMITAGIVANIYVLIIPLRRLCEALIH